MDNNSETCGEVKVFWFFFSKKNKLSRCRSHTQRRRKRQHAEAYGKPERGDAHHRGRNNGAL
jgi:hypothetical protein